MNRAQALKILGLSEPASLDEIKKAYRGLASIHHPDKNPENKKQAEERFKEITSAYEVLTKPQKETGGPSFSDVFSDFEKMFSGRFKFTGGRQSSSAQVPPKIKIPTERVFRMQDVEVSVPVDIEAVLLRTPIEVKLELDCVCSTCLGDRASWFPCKSCGQTGVIVNNTRTPMGNFVTQQACPTCSGQGWVRAAHCKTCKDRLVYKRVKQVSFTIPPDFLLGSKLKLGGAGMEGWNCKHSDLVINPRIDIPDYSTLTEEERTRLLELLGKK